MHLLQYSACNVGLRLIRCMLTAPPRTHIGPVGLLPVEDQVKLLKLNHVWYNSQKGPRWTIALIWLETNTRASMACSVPCVKSKTARSSFFNTRISLCNNFPLHIKQSQRTFLKQMLRQLCGRVDGSLWREGVWTVGWQVRLVGLFYRCLFPCIVCPPRTTLE